MPGDLQVRPGRLNVDFYPGKAFTLTMDWQTSAGVDIDLTGRTFTAASGDTSFTASVNGDGDLVVTASAANTTALGTGSHSWSVTETTSGSDPVITGVLVGRAVGSASYDSTVTVVSSTASVSVTALGSAGGGDVDGGTP